MLVKLASEKCLTDSNKVTTPSVQINFKLPNYNRFFVEFEGICLGTKQHSFGFAGEDSLISEEFDLVSLDTMVTAIETFKLPVDFTYITNNAGVYECAEYSDEYFVSNVDGHVLIVTKSNFVVTGDPAIWKNKKFVKSNKNVKINFE